MRAPPVTVIRGDGPFQKAYPAEWCPPEGVMDPSPAAAAAVAAVTLRGCGAPSGSSSGGGSKGSTGSAKGKRHCRHGGGRRMLFGLEALKAGQFDDEDVGAVAELMGAVRANEPNGEGAAKELASKRKKKPNTGKGWKAPAKRGGNLNGTKLKETPRDRE